MIITEQDFKKEIEEVFSGSIYKKIGLKEDPFVIDPKDKVALFVDRDDPLSKLFRSQKNIKKVLIDVKNKSGEQIKIVTTDGYTAYEKAVKQTWGYDNHTREYKINHKVVTQRKGEGFNIWVERLNGSIRQRTTGFRGMHGSVESAYAILKSLEIFYNFVNKHGALNGKSPSELAIPSLQFKTANRWVELINLAQQNL